MSYSKLHSSIVNSSLWTERDSVRLLFITLLAMCDRDGIVYGSKPGLSRIAMIDPDEQDDAWDALMSPDPDSCDRMRAPENEGRRIEEIPGGFRLLNFEYYRGLRNEDDRREQNRIAQARFKAKNKPQSATVSHGNPPKAHTEAEAETDTEEEGENSLSVAAASPSEEEFVAECKRLKVPVRFAREKFHWQDAKGWPANWKAVARRVKGWHEQNGGRSGEWLPSKPLPEPPPLSPEELAAAEAFKKDAERRGIKLKTNPAPSAPA